MTPADYWSTFVRHSPLGILSDLDGTLLELVGVQPAGSPPFDGVSLVEQLKYAP